MEKLAIDQLEELYKDELDSHDIKRNNNNAGITNSFKFNDFLYKNKLSSKNSKYISDNKVRNTITYKNKNKKDNININTFTTKEKGENIFNNSLESKKKEEEKVNDINDTKFKKKKNFELKTCKTFKNCGENINKAQLLLFNKANNKQQQLINPRQKMSTKNCLSSAKRGSLLQNSKRFKKQKEMIEKESLFKNENEVSNALKRKKTYFRSNNSNNKLLYISKRNNIFELEEESDKEDNNNQKDNKDNYNNVFNQFKKNNNACNNYMNGNDNKKRKKFNTTRRFRHDNQDKIKKSNKLINLSPEIIIDTDNEVETNILCLLDKSFKNKKRFSVINNKKSKNYGTFGIVNDKVLRNFKSSLESKKIKSNINEIGKTSHSNSISIIKNTEVNHCTINDIESNDDFFFNLENNKHRFRNISAQKVVSFEYKDNDNEENGFNDNLNFNSNQKNKNKNKKKFIIYNNINYYKTTQRGENDLENAKDGNNDNQNGEVIYNKKNSINNNSNNTKNCCSSLFNCCFLLE
jgi:hypothetical protein